MARDENHRRIRLSSVSGRSHCKQPLPRPLSPRVRLQRRPHFPLETAASSPPLPKTKGSPPFKRTTSFPSFDFSTSNYLNGVLMDGCSTGLFTHIDQLAILRQPKREPLDELGNRILRLGIAEGAPWPVSSANPDFPGPGPD